MSRQELETESLEREAPQAWRSVDKFVHLLLIVLAILVIVICSK